MKFRLNDMPTRLYVGHSEWLSTSCGLLSGDWSSTATHTAFALGIPGTLTAGLKCSFQWETGEVTWLSMSGVLLKYWAVPATHPHLPMWFCGGKFYWAEFLTSLYFGSLLQRIVHFIYLNCSHQTKYENKHQNWPLCTTLYSFRFIIVV